MNSKKILVLGNEFVKVDSFAKNIIEDLKKEFDDDVIVNIKDSFELVDYLDEDIIIIDVVEGLDEVRLLNINDLKSGSIISAHDFDASLFLQMFSNKDKIKIIGIPINGDKDKIIEIVLRYCKDNH